MLVTSNLNNKLVFTGALEGIPFITIFLSWYVVTFIGSTIKKTNHQRRKKIPTIINKLIQPT
tara:strand:+ start:1391 stop:1576 length:186 start_codon:yes stop_codon:yes gene_type:complete